MKPRSLFSPGAFALGVAALSLMPGAEAEPYWQTSMTGVITQAPAANPFGAAVGDSVSFSAVIDAGEFCYGMPSCPPDSAPDAGFPTFSADLTIGAATYHEGFNFTEFLSYKDSNLILDLLTFVDGRISDMRVQFSPLDDCGPGVSCPILTFDGGTGFFTGDTFCDANAVCGRLDPAGSALHAVAVPEPASAALLLTVLGMLAVCRRRRLPTLARFPCRLFRGSA